MSDYEALSGDSAEDYNAACDAGAVKPGDIIVFWNASGATVHCGIAGEDKTIYHAWHEGFDTGNCRFDHMWGINGGHGKTYASFKVYQGLTEGGYVTLDKSSGDVKVTKGNFPVLAGRSRVRRLQGRLARNQVRDERKRARNHR
nr:hypothetical protein [uncultured Olsenella sp.]